MPIDQDALERARAAWTFRGRHRPAFAHVPGEGQESVWDYPRPPLYVPDQRPIEIHAGTRCLARSDVSIRVLETGSPPTVYLPPDVFDASLLRPSPRRTRFMVGTPIRSCSICIGATATMPSAISSTMLVSRP